MEFKSLKNIETSFRQIRFFALVFICLCAGITVYSVWNAFSYAEAQRQKIYVLDQGKSLMLALSQDMDQNRPVEARDHVTRFHELFFTLSPDREAIETNISRALYLADKSAYNYYQDIQEKGYFNRVVAGNIQQVIQGRQRVMQLRKLSLHGCYLRPAKDYPVEQCNRTLAGYPLQPD